LKQIRRNTIVDIFACENCRLKGDKWEMQQHPCKGSKK
jgi:hypothetical protein